MQPSTGSIQPSRIHDTHLRQATLVGGPGIVAGVEATRAGVATLAFIAWSTYMATFSMRTRVKDYGTSICAEAGTTAYRELRDGLVVGGTRVSVEG